jgi:polynucleotide 5'-hydroxyl-kinase GRC3/NOL9
MTPVVSVSKESSLKVYGPMNIHVKKGVIDVLGKIFAENSRVIVHKTKTYIIRALEDSELDMLMGEEASYQPLDEDDPYLVKYALAQEIASSHGGLIVLVGGTDSGKSSFATLLSNLVLRKSGSPVIIDGDVGQSNLGPPGFVSAGRVAEPVLWAGEVKPEKLRFIGDVKPHGNIWKIISSVKELAAEFIKAGSTHIIVDTDGWIRDEKGLRYKVSLISTLNPNYIVVFGTELSPYFRKFSSQGVKVFEFKISSTRKVRSREERRILRSMKYREYLYDAPIVKLGFENLIINGLPILEGIPVELSRVDKFVEGKITYASLLPDKLCLAGTIRRVEEDGLKKEFGVAKISVFEPGAEKNLYAAVSNGDFEYPALIDKIDFQGRKIIIKTRFTDKINEVKVSTIRLRDDFTEEFLEVFP